MVSRLKGIGFSDVSELSTRLWMFMGLEFDGGKAAPRSALETGLGQFLSQNELSSKMGTLSIFKDGDSLKREGYMDSV